MLPIKSSLINREPSRANQSRVARRIRTTEHVRAQAPSRKRKRKLQAVLDLRPHETCEPPRFVIDLCRVLRVHRQRSTLSTRF